MKIIVLGDFVSTEKGICSVDNKSAIDNNIKDILLNADITLINLEAPIIDKKCNYIKKVGPNINTSSQTISYLKETGITALTLANNHFYDYGDRGVDLTISAAEQNEMDFVGGGRNPKEKRKILYKEIENKKIAILNFCESEFSVGHYSGSNEIDTINVYNDITTAKNNSDFIIVITHGGHEGYQLPSPRMKKLYRFFIDVGANMVINHHQHCYSGFEKYNKGIIYYGLGNFYFFSPLKEEKEWYEGFFIEITINKELTPSVKEYPYIQCKGKKILTRLMDDSERKIFKQNLLKINEIISDDERLKKEFQTFCKKKEKNYKAILSPYSNRCLMLLCKMKLLPSFTSKKKIRSVLNNIRCESHRDMMINILNENNG